MKTKGLIRTLAAVLLAALLVPSLFACTKKTDEQLIVGSWTGEIDYTEQMKATVNANPDPMFGSVEVEDFKLKVTVEFKEDGTYSALADEESFKAATRKLIEQITPQLKTIITSLLSAFGGSELTDEQMLEMLEISSWDELADQVLDKGFNSDLGTASGKWELRDGKLYMTDSVDKAVDDSCLIGAYELTDTALKLNLDGSNSKSTIFPSDLKSVELKKAAAE